MKKKTKEIINVTDEELEVFMHGFVPYMGKSLSEISENDKVILSNDYRKEVKKDGRDIVLRNARRSNNYYTQVYHGVFHGGVKT